MLERRTHAYSRHMVGVQKGIGSIGTPHSPPISLMRKQRLREVE